MLAAPWTAGSARYIRIARPTTASNSPSTSAKRLDVAFEELDVGQAGCRGQPGRAPDCVQVPVDADDDALRSDEFGGEPGHVADTAAEIEDSHARGQPGGGEQPPGQWVEKFSLREQAIFLGLLVVREVFPLLRHPVPL